MRSQWARAGGKYTGAKYDILMNIAVGTCWTAPSSLSSHSGSASSSSSLYSELKEDGTCRSSKLSSLENEGFLLAFPSPWQKNNERRESGRVPGFGGWGAFYRRERGEAKRVRVMKSSQRLVSKFPPILHPDQFIWLPLDLHIILSARVICLTNINSNIKENANSNRHDILKSKPMIQQWRCGN